MRSEAEGLSASAGGGSGAAGSLTELATPSARNLRDGRQPWHLLPGESPARHASREGPSGGGWFVGLGILTLQGTAMEGWAAKWGRLSLAPKALWSDDLAEGGSGTPGCGPVPALSEDNGINACLPRGQSSEVCGRVPECKSHESYRRRRADWWVRRHLGLCLGGWRGRG